MAASLNDMTDSLPIRRGETWLCELGHEPESIQCRLLDADQPRSRSWTFADRGSHTCVLIDEDDYKPNPSERTLVDIWAFTQVILPRGAAFALACFEAGRTPSAISWRCLHPADSVDAQSQNSIWINIDTEVNLVVHRSEADAFMSMSVGQHPVGWGNL